MKTTTPGAIACGDVHRDISPVVWVIAHGPNAARGIDRYIAEGRIFRRGRLPANSGSVGNNFNR